MMEKKTNDRDKQKTHKESVKSLQLILNELKNQLSIPSISHSAFSQRRAQLKHTAFIELNQKAVVDVQYGDG
ncbi:MAG: hypothetical protein SVR94_14795, partial [Pseudomonadota bacterium]|nr:hypothetical protein [Pseudomonadota bacterium]